MECHGMSWNPCVSWKLYKQAAFLQTQSSRTLQGKSNKKEFELAAPPATRRVSPAADELRPSSAASTAIKGVCWSICGKLQRKMRPEGAEAAATGCLQAHPWQGNGWASTMVSAGQSGNWCDYAHARSASSCLGYWIWHRNTIQPLLHKQGCTFTGEVGLRGAGGGTCAWRIPRPLWSPSRECGQINVPRVHE
jgi:hypothetical protein